MKTKIERVKNEEMSDDEFRLTAITIEDGVAMNNMPLNVVLDLTLASRPAEYIDELWKKLQEEGLTEARSISSLSRGAIEAGLGKRDYFKMGEIADVVAVRAAILKSCRGSKGKRSGKSRVGSGGRDRDRSRSGGREHRWRDSSRGKGKGDKGKGKRIRDGRDRSPEDAAPLLWKAASENNIDLCRNLLHDQSIDVDETHKLWTPLMKAADRGHVRVVRLLLESRADIKAMNKMGRDALSFAAAPSNTKATNDENLRLLRLLVERGADPHRKDERGQTAKERARMQGSDDIVECLEEPERSNDFEM